MTHPAITGLLDFLAEPTRVVDYTSLFSDEERIFSQGMPPLPPDEAVGAFGSFGGVNRRRDEIAFRRKLLVFARTNAVPIDDHGDWYRVAIELAARRHPALNIAKRSRGRPRKIPDPGGLLSALLGTTLTAGITEDSKRAETLVLRIDQINASRGRRERKITDAAVARKMAGIDADAELAHLDNVTLNNINHWKKLLSAARKSLGRRKRFVPK